MLPVTDPNSLLLGGLYLLLTMLVGYAVVSEIIGGGTRHWVQLISYCYGAGSGIMGFLLFAISLAGVRPSRGVLIGIAIVAIAALAWLARSRKLCVLSVPSPRRKLDPLALLAVLSLMLIVAAASNIATSAALPGLNDIDTFGIWAFKAKWVYLSALHPLPRAFFDPNLSYAHQDYPLLVPFNIAGLYAAVGKIDEDAAKLLLMPAWLALTGIVYGAIRRMHRRAMAVILTAIFCSAPILARNAGFIVAETPLLLALAGASAQLLCWIDDGDPRELMLGGLFIAMAAFTKNEGLALLPVYALFAFVSALSSRFAFFRFPLPVRRERVRVRVDLKTPSDAEASRTQEPSPQPSPGVPGEGASIRGTSAMKRTIADCWPALVICLLCIGPWLILRSRLPHTHEDYGDRLLSAALIRQIPQRIGAIGQFFSWFAIADRAGLVWYLLVLTTILWPSRLITKPALALWAVLLVQLGLYLATFIVTPWDVNVLVPMITPKLQTQMTPTAILLIAVNLWKCKDAPAIHPGLRA